MKKLRHFLAIVLVGALAVSAGWYFMGRGQPGTQRAGGKGNPADAPVPVLAAQARVEDVPVYINGVGTVRALNMVTIHTLVNGTLVRVAFREGQDVKRGDVLAVVDPTTYQAQLDQSVAKKALNEATLANAKLDQERYTNLVKSNAVTHQQLDTQNALVAQLEAQVKLDQGAIDNAKAYVNYCTIVSPLDGRLGIRLVDQGNIVNTSDANGIVVVTQIQPIAMLFNFPQQVLGKVNAGFAQGPLGVDAMDSDNQVVLDHGALTVVNNQVDQTTGTVQLKAEFPNPKLQLWPGQFVNVRLLIDTLHQVVVVPTAAVQRGPNGAFVYLTQPDSTVKLQAVTVTQQDDKIAVIASGVQAADRVVTSGFVQLTDGHKIVATNAEAAAPSGDGKTPSKPKSDGDAGKDHAGHGKDRPPSKTSNAAPSAIQ